MLVREEHLLCFDVSFYDPKGKLVRTYKDNHLGPISPTTGEPYLNFAFDVAAKEILQEGGYNIDDDHVKFRNGFVMGEGSPDDQTPNGLTFWTVPDGVLPHFHVTEWPDENDERVLGYPPAFGPNYDVSFQYNTTEQLIGVGAVGAAYYEYDEVEEMVVTNNLRSFPAAKGMLVRVHEVKPSKKEKARC